MKKPSKRAPCPPPIPGKRKPTNTRQQTDKAEENIFRKGGKRGRRA
jgi:hypothetical protein